MSRESGIPSAALVEANDSDLLWQRDTRVGTCARAASSTETTAAANAPSSSIARERPSSSARLLLRRSSCLTYVDLPVAVDEDRAPGRAARGRLLSHASKTLAGRYRS